MTPAQINWTLCSPHRLPRDSMSSYRYRSLASQLKVTAAGVATQQARHFRTALGGDSRELLSAVREATRAVFGGGADLLTPSLDHLPALVREWILDQDRARGRLDVQLELEIAQLFALRTDAMARRCLELARLALTVTPGSSAQRFLSRVGRSYIAGFYPEAIIMCRSTIEQAVVDRFARARKPLPRADDKSKSDMRARLRKAEDLGWITRGQHNDAWQVWLRGNKTVHDDPNITTDVAGTIMLTLSVLSALHPDESAA